MHGQVHAAVEVRKLHATRTDAFDAPPEIVAGTVGTRGVRYRVAAAPRPEPGVLSLGDLDALPRVDVLLTYQGATADLIEAAVNAGARGLVVASAGAGSLTPAQADAVRRLGGSGVLVAIASRTGAGRVPRPDQEAGAWISAGDLPPLKARVLLMLALGHELPRARVAALFDEASGALPQ